MPAVGDQIRSRLYGALVVLSVLPLAVAGRLVYLNGPTGDALRAEGTRQAAAVKELPAVRGPILDASGRVLATTVSRFDLALDPTTRGFDEIADEFYETLADVTGRSSREIRRRVRTRRSPQYVVLARGLTEAQMERLDSLRVPGLIRDARTERRYTYGATLAHVIGHVGRDGHGLAGLESQYDAALAGTPGRRPMQRIRRPGAVREVVGAHEIAPQNGEALVLTVDLIRQTMLEDELAAGIATSGGRWATAIAMDPHTGAVLAMAGLPTYDPNRPGAYDEAHRRNHGVTDQMEPGSTFKLVAAAAAVEAGKVTEREGFATGSGVMTIGGRMVRDDHPGGTMTLDEVMAQSSNIGAALIATRAGRQAYYAMARGLGFGQPTLVDLPGEAAGRLKPLSAWQRSTLASMAFGYEVLATPLQILTAYCALANGGLLVRPHLVAARRDVQGRTVWAAPPDSVRRAFSSETARRLRPAFERVITDGTGQKAALVGLPVAGKTGTARRNDGGGYAGYRSSFVGFFPADDPQVALLVVVDSPTESIYGGEVAAPIFQRIATRWAATLPRVTRRLAPPTPLPVRRAVAVPRVAGLPVVVASQRLRAAGLDAPIPEGAAPAMPVVQQAPGAGLAAAPGSSVRLVASTRPSREMPDLRGLSTRQARTWLAGLGVEARIDGAGVVRRQSPDAGAPLPRTARLTASATAPRVAVPSTSTDGGTR